jgi:hypothetical protein
MHWLQEHWHHLKVQREAGQETQCLLNSTGSTRSAPSYLFRFFFDYNSKYLLPFLLFFFVSGASDAGPPHPRLLPSLVLVL